MNDVSIDIIFKKLLAKKDLNLVESNFLVKKIFSSDFNSNQLSSILTLLFQKKECFEEIFAFSQYLKYVNAVGELPITTIGDLLPEFIADNSFQPSLKP